MAVTFADSRSAVVCVQHYMHTQEIFFRIAARFSNKQKKQFVLSGFRGEMRRGRFASIAVAALLAGAGEQGTSSNRAACGQTRCTFIYPMNRDRSTTRRSRFRDAGTILGE